MIEQHKIDSLYELFDGDLDRVSAMLELLESFQIFQAIHNLPTKSLKILSKHNKKWEVPSGAYGNAKTALMWKTKYGAEVSGLTKDSLIKAQQITLDRKLDLSSISRIAHYDRNRQQFETAVKLQKEEGNPPWAYPAIVNWLAWGGTSGIDWAKSVNFKYKDNDMANKETGDAVVDIVVDDVSIETTLLDNTEHPENLDSQSFEVELENVSGEFNEDVDADNSSPQDDVESVVDVEVEEASETEFTDVDEFDYDEVVSDNVQAASLNQAFAEMVKAINAVNNRIETLEKNLADKKTEDKLTLSKDKSFAQNLATLMRIQKAGTATKAVETVVDDTVNNGENFKTPPAPEVKEKSKSPVERTIMNLIKGK